MVGEAARRTPPHAQLERAVRAMRGTYADRHVLYASRARRISPLSSRR
jgi:hypothetical protein